ncbi:MAG: DNA ligase [Alteromonadaceae bacterium]|nr:DNA ligase [Alteromonadaceae bacterium]
MAANPPHFRSIPPVFVIFFLIGLVFAPLAQTRAQPPGLMLANVYADQDDLEAYWVSEKLDGVRAYWDGAQFLSRQGNRFHAPAWFSSGFPAVPLDGELWMGRGTFEKLMGAVRQQEPDDALWQRVRFMVFDMPEARGNFDQRLGTLRRLLATPPSPYIEVVRQFRLATREQLLSKLDSVVDGGGEGLMLHRGDSLYRAARTDDLLKVKTHDDAEARVLEHLPGQGKYAGLLGSLVVQTPAGLSFRLGTGFTDAQRRTPPPVGSLVTYKFFGKTRNGIPRFASFLRVRQEVKGISQH